MEARLEALEKEIRDMKMGKPEKKEKATRKPSAYNDFMKTELAKLKLSNPEMPHKERFKLAASHYSGKKLNAD
tara:strand:- start:888 stop:1106 length:219 start_codon:yes stop_codon:yes gene_type:complete